MHDPRISALLRVKRFEQPPSGYFDKLLGDVHRRQRAELLHRPLWKIAVERMQVFFSEHSMGNLSYAGAMAAVLAVGMGVIGLMTPGQTQAPGPGAAIATAEPAPEPPQRYADAGGANHTLILEQKAPVPMQVGVPAASNVAPPLSSPRYIMDLRPASYDPGNRF